MQRTRDQKTTAILATILFLTAFTTVIGTGQGLPLQSSEPGDWIEDRAVIAFHESVPEGIDSWVAEQGGEILLVDDRIHFIVAEFPTSEHAQAAIQQASAREDVRHAEHDAALHTHTPVEVMEAITSPTANQNSFPDNPLWDEQWGPRAIQLENAWTHTLGSHEVNIAIADTGIKGDHPNLVNNICGPHISGSGDPLVDTHGHGTHVAGTAAARIDSGIGIAGVSQSCLMAIRVLGSGSAGLAAGITFAADNGAHVINMSFWSTFSQTFKDALDYAYIERDVVLVKSAGNGGCSGGTGLANTDAYTSSHTMSWPGPEPSVIAVAALSPPFGEERAGFSSCGNQMELAAPGQQILAPYRDGYAYLSGTSMAAPHVSGVAALMRSADPDLTALEVRCLLAWTADDLGPDGWDPFYGWGRINAEAAVQSAIDWIGGTLQQNPALKTCGLPQAPL